MEAQGSSKRQWVALGVAGVMLAAGLAWLVATSGDGDDEAERTTSTTTSSEAITSIDFQNFGYRLSCDAQGTYDVTVVDGLWEGTSTVEPDVALSTSEGIEAVYVEDATQDTTDAVVRVPCSYGANTVISNVFVFRLGDEGKPEQIGDTVFGFAPTAGPAGGQFFVWNEAPTDGDAGCCPSFFERSTYTIGDDRIEHLDTVRLAVADTPFAQSAAASEAGITSSTLGEDDPRTVETRGRTVDEVLDGLRHPVAGQPTTYIRGAFEIRSGAVVRDGIGPEAAVVTQTAFFQNPELVTVDGIKYAISTESGDQSSSPRQLRVTPVSALQGFGMSPDDIRTSTISRLDEAGDAHVDDDPYPGYEIPGGGTIVRQFADESGDALVAPPHTQVLEDRG